MTKQKTSIINLEKFINSFQDNVPDTLEFDLLKLLSKVGFSQEYNIDLFTGEVDFNEIKPTEFLYFYLQAKVKLDLVRFMKENISLLMTHQNPEVRTFSENFLKLIPHREGETVTVRMDEIEVAHVKGVLQSVGWNKKTAAEILGLSVKTLYSKIQAYGLTEVK